MVVTFHSGDPVILQSGGEPGIEKRFGDYFINLTFDHKGAAKTFFERGGDFSVPLNTLPFYNLSRDRDMVAVKGRLDQAIRESHTPYCGGAQLRSYSSARGMNIVLSVTLITSLQKPTTQPQGCPKYAYTSTCYGTRVNGCVVCSNCQHTEDGCSEDWGCDRLVGTCTPAVSVPIPHPERNPFSPTYNPNVPQWVSVSVCLCQ